MNDRSSERILSTTVAEFHNQIYIYIYNIKFHTSTYNCYWAEPTRKKSTSSAQVGRGQKAESGNLTCCAFSLILAVRCSCLSSCPGFVEVGVGQWGQRNLTWKRSSKIRSRLAIPLSLSVSLVSLLLRRFNPRNFLH